MAENKKAEPVKKQTQPESKFKKEKLREHSVELFGITTSTFDGAFYGAQGDEFSIAEAKKIIHTFLKGDKD